MKLKIFKLTLLITLVILSACASGVKEKQKVDTTKSNIANQTNMTSANSLDDVLKNLNKVSTRKKFFIYDKSISSNEELLSDNCMHFVSDPLPKSYDLYTDFIIEYFLDDGRTYSFLKKNESEYSLSWYRCYDFSEWEYIEDTYKECSIDKKINKCFALSLLEPDTTPDPEKAVVVKKSALNVLCRISKDACNLSRHLLVLSTSNNKLSKTDLVLLTSIDKSIRAKIKAEEMVILKQEADDQNAEKLRVKEEKSISDKMSKCDSGNDQSCWELYIYNINNDPSSSLTFLNKACDLGHSKACTVVQNKRQIQIQEDERNEQAQRQYRLEQQEEEDRRAQNLQNYLKSTQQIQNSFKVKDSNSRKCVSVVEFGQVVTRCKDD